MNSIINKSCTEASVPHPIASITLPKTKNYGAYILGKMRLLNDKTACCFPGFEQDLMGADVKFNDVCVSGTIITSRGAGTAHKLGFKIVEIFKGKKTADILAENMIYITH